MPATAPRTACACRVRPAAPPPLSLSSLSHVAAGRMAGPGERHNGSAWSAAAGRSHVTGSRNLAHPAVSTCSTVHRALTNPVTRAGVGGAGGWQFRGKRIAAAVARRLLGELGLDAGAEVLLTGDSAGGVGCLHNADWLHDMLQCAARAPSGARVARACRGNRMRSGQAQHLHYVSAACALACKGDPGLRLYDTIRSICNPRPPVFACAVQAAHAAPDYLSRVY